MFKDVIGIRVSTFQTINRTNTDGLMSPTEMKEHLRRFRLFDENICSIEKPSDVYIHMLAYDDSFELISMANGVEYLVEKKK